MRHLLCEATGPVVGSACDDLLTPAIAKLAAPSMVTLAADPRATSSGEEASSGACYCLASFYTLLCEWAAKEGGDSEERAAKEGGDSEDLLRGEGGSGEQPGEQEEEEPVVQAEAAQPASAWEDEARLEEQTSPMATRAAGSREGSPSVERSGASGGAELV